MSCAPLRAPTMPWPLVQRTHDLRDRELPDHVPHAQRRRVPDVRRKGDPPDHVPRKHVPHARRQRVPHARRKGDLRLRAPQTRGSRLRDGPPTTAASTAVRATSAPCGPPPPPPCGGAANAADVPAAIQSNITCRSDGSLVTNSFASRSPTPAGLKHRSLRNPTEGPLGAESEDGGWLCAVPPKAGNNSVSPPISVVT